MPDLKPYIVLGLAVGGVFSLSGVGIVVLYRATAVLNLAYGAIGAVGALLAYSLTTGVGLSTWLSVAIVVVFCGMLSLVYGTFFGAAFALREPLVKMIGTLAVLLILLGAMSMIWTSQAYSLTLPTTNWSFQVSGVNVTGTQLIGLVLGVAVTAATAALLRYTKLGAGMRALADDRQAAAILGVPVRRVEAAAWLASGLLAGVTGVLLSNLVAFDAADLTFLVVPALAAAVVGRLQSLWLTLIGGLVIGVIQSCVTAFNSVSDYSAATPFVVAIVVMLWFARRRSTIVRV
jgi:branched-chain amino acid transport system permease protein